VTIARINHSRITTRDRVFDAVGVSFVHALQGVRTSVMAIHAHCAKAPADSRMFDEMADMVMRPDHMENRMTEARHHLVDWLRDAHAMEQQAEQMLKGQAARIEHYPELKARIEQHIEETRGQQALLETCLKRLDASPSLIKDTMGKVAAFGQAVGGMMASDEIVKGAMAGYVFEQMEIASYTALIAAADAVGDTETSQACEQILEEEQAMADWLQDHLPEVVQAFLVRSETPGATAKK